MPIIYTVYSKHHGKIVYVGKSLSDKTSAREYIQRNDATRNRNSSFCASIRKYGWDNFVYDVTEYVEGDNTLLCEREIFWIDYYNTYKSGLNMTRGGEGTETKNVAKYDRSGKLIDIYSSVTEAAERNNVPISHISNIIHKSSNLRQKNGFRYLIFNDVPIPRIDEFQKANYKRPVKRKSDDVTYNSIKEAAMLNNTTSTTIRRQIAKNTGNWEFV